VKTNYSTHQCLSPGARPATGWRLRAHHRAKCRCRSSARTAEG